MTRNRFLAFLAGMAGGSIAVLFSGCKAGQEPAATEEAAEAPSKAEEPVFTKDDPGAWEGKESGHVPVIEYEKTDGGLKVTVTVNHVMDAEIPHYIEWIKLMDGEGNVLGQQEFQARAEKAVATFELSSVPAKLVAHERCNIHGIWMEEVTVS